MGKNGTTQVTFGTADLIKALNAARRGNFKVRIPTRHSVVPRKVAEGLNDILSINGRMAVELEELRRERKDVLRTLLGAVRGGFTARASSQHSSNPGVASSHTITACVDRHCE